MDSMREAVQRSRDASVDREMPVVSSSLASVQYKTKLLEEHTKDDYQCVGTAWGVVGLPVLITR